MTHAVASVSCQQAETFTPAHPQHRVVLWDFGAKENIQRELIKRGCEVIRMPYDATAENIHAAKPDGIMLSNGPGDPMENTGIITQLKKLCGAKLPTFGICLGHQLLALSQGPKPTNSTMDIRGPTSRPKTCKPAVSISPVKTMGMQ